MLAYGRITRIFDTLLAPYADVQLVRSSEESHRVYTLEDEFLGSICKQDNGTWTGNPRVGRIAHNMTRSEVITHLVLADRAERNKPERVVVKDGSDYPATVELTVHGNGWSVEFAGEHIGSLYPGDFYHCEGWVVFDTDAICHRRDSRNDALDLLLTRMEELRLKAEAVRRARWIRDTVAEIAEQAQADESSAETVALELLGWVKQRTRNGYMPS